MRADEGYAAVHDARGELARLFDDLWTLGKPTIARVRGYCLAGGFGLALSCDLVVASDDSTFGTPEIDVGLWPYMITVPLCRSAGRRRRARPGAATCTRRARPSRICTGYRPGISTPSRPSHPSMSLFMPNAVDRPPDLKGDGPVDDRRRLRTRATTGAARRGLTARPRGRGRRSVRRGPTAFPAPARRDRSTWCRHHRERSVERDVIDAHPEVAGVPDAVDPPREPAGPWGPTPPR